MGERDLHRLSSFQRGCASGGSEMLSERDVPKWRECVKQVHARQLFCSLRPATHFGKTMDYLMNGLECRRRSVLTGKPILTGGFASSTRDAGLLHKQSAVCKYIRQQVYLFCGSAATPSWWTTAAALFAAHRGGCFCPYCMSGFRDYQEQVQHRTTPGHGCREHGHVRLSSDGA